MMLSNRLTSLTVPLHRLNETFTKLSLVTVSNFWQRLYCQRVTINDEEMSEDEERIPHERQKTIKKKRGKSTIGADLVEAYIMNNNPDILKWVPKTYIKMSATANQFFLIEESTAEQFVSLVADDLMKNISFVVESHPGPGLLTRALLNAGIPLIHMYENISHFRPRLESLTEEFPGRLDLRSYDFNKLGKIMFMDNVKNEQQLEDMMKGIEQRKWEDKTSMQVITSISNDSFMRQIINNVVFLNPIVIYGRPLFYAVIQPSLWTRYTNIQKAAPMSRNILFQLFFDYEKLGEINRKSFLPWPKQSKVLKRKRNLIHCDDQESMFVVKFEPKQDLFQNVISKKDLVPFWHFLRHNIVIKKKRVIPELEKLIPDCGFKLIMKDYDIFTEFNDLTPVQLLDLYKELRSWPEFESSSFLASVEAVVSKMDENLIGIHDPDCSPLDT